ncbi:hypothetical protein DL89DRAFT_271644 [Linderina pennispora]|uniref:Uncharacterized protein n=1 Tax=Linderina pennispora TaxID=61395 RepID=A0A1Y1VUJ2_9FUNG|nr:uncharacterized protein DL89DRAFT_271644 [Linderina pennispora]ORX64960.1 hypothetical protein DL89DRAFT_271644 [Linderina pennispora]
MLNSDEHEHDEVHLRDQDQDQDPGQNNVTHAQGSTRNANTRSSTLPHLRNKSALYAPLTDPNTGIPIVYATHKV